MTDEQFRQKCGGDAVQYLRFQRHLMAFVSVVTIVSIGVILPINYQGISFTNNMNKINDEKKIISEREKRFRTSVKSNSYSSF